MNIALWLARSAERYPQQAAIAHGTEVWCDYAEFAHRAARTGRATCAPHRVYPLQERVDALSRRSGRSPRTAQ